MLPDITCIIPTTKRRLPFLPLALDSLKAQTGPIRYEVIIASEDAEARAKALELCLSLGIRDSLVLATSAKQTSPGAKRNSCCAVARAPWITFWDDDDWSREDRLELTLDHTSADVDLLGAPCMLVHEAFDPRRRTYEFRYKKTNETYPDWFFVGGTLTFRKTLWMKLAFEADTIGEEAWWQLKMPDVARRELHADATLYVSMLHSKNTAYTQSTMPQGDPCLTPWPGDLEKLMGKERLDRYRTAALLAHQ